MIIARIVEFIDSIKIDRIEFDRACGFSKGYINNAYSNNSIVGTDKIAKISEIYPDINLEWLITGRGEMLKSNSTNPVEDSAAYRELERKYIRCLEEKDTLKKTTNAGIVAVTRKKKLK